MSAEIVKIASGRERPAVRGCDTCVHRKGEAPSLNGCGVFDILCAYARGPGLCNGGEKWEPKPPRIPGIFERTWRFLFGGRGM